MILLIGLIDMIPFNESSEDVSQVVRTNRDGRVRYTSEQKEKVLDLFEQSGMSGKAFAEEHGIKYPTFALWRRQRRESRHGPENQNQVDEGFLLAEISPRRDVNDGLTLLLPGGREVRACGPNGVDLLAQLIAKIS